MQRIDRNSHRTEGATDAREALREGEDPSALREYAEHGRDLARRLYDIGGDRADYQRVQYYEGMLEAVNQTKIVR